MNNIWDPVHECMAREDLEQLQLERLQATINRVYKNVTFYRRKFHDLGIIPENRSEERRVGKECRSRWSPYH